MAAGKTKKKDIVDLFFETKKMLAQTFNYAEDWCVIPWDDFRRYEWYLEKGKEIHDEFYNGFQGKVIFWNSLQDIQMKTEWYESIIYTQRFLPRWVYETDRYTMICIDTQTDGNKLLAIFDNKKRFLKKPPILIQAEEILAAQYPELPPEAK